MNDNKEKKSMIGKFGNKNNGLLWSIGGMMGGVVVGITLASIYGWTVLSASFWIGFGLIVGAISGAVSYMLYQIIYGAVATKRGG